MNRFLLCIFSILILHPVGALGQHQQSFSPHDANYLWPTNIHYLTSTFAETRSNHFHAALDLKTWGQRGYEVYATRDGIIQRLSIGPTGYGKVVYLKHRDGSFSVYAHLMAFNNKLQQLADSIRIANGYKFEIDRYISSREIKVARGDVIGYSGASGIGPPHLHFELRTPDHKPFNPLLTNLTVRDNIAPRFRALSVEPLTARTRIEGENDILTQAIYKNGRNFETNNLTISGPIGLGVKVFDQSNGVHNEYAVYQLSLAIDGQEVFSSRVDSFSYNETGQLFLDRVYPLLKKYGSSYQRLFIADGNTLPFYKTGHQKGRLHLKPGTHKITIRASDFFGNESSVSFRITVKKNNPGYSTPVHKQNAVTLPPFRWDWFDNWVTVPKSVISGLTIAAEKNNTFLKYKNGVGVKLHDNLFINLPKIGPVKFWRIQPASDNLIGAIEHESFAIFPEHTFYDTLSVAMSVDEIKPDSIQVYIIPDAFPLRQSYKMYINFNPAITDTSNLSFYYWDRDDLEWELIPTEFHSNYIVGATESLGMFTTLRDTTAPRLSNPQLNRRPDGQWLVMVDVRDNLSGVDYRRAKIWINGKPGIVEFEPEDDRFVYYLPDFIPTPEMKIKVRAFDYMGNKRERIFYLNHPQVYAH